VLDWRGFDELAVALIIYLARQALRWPPTAEHNPLSAAQATSGRDRMATRPNTDEPKVGDH
jgi:hypothetical protein